MPRLASSRHPAGSDRSTTTSTRAIAWAEGRVLPAAEATVPLTDDGFLRGDAVFDAMLVRDGRSHARHEHLARLQRSGDAMEIAIPDLDPVINDLLAAWGQGDGVLRLVVTRAGTVRGLLTALAIPPAQTLAIVDLPWGGALTGVKTLSYATNQWATRQALARGADDALIVTDGVVHELPTGAICWVDDGRLFAPDHDQLRILDSVTLAELREIVEVTATVGTVDDLRHVDEVFVLSAGRPVVAVDRILVDDEELTYPAPGPVTTQIQQAFAAYITDTLDR